MANDNSYDNFVDEKQEIKDDEDEENTDDTICFMSKELLPCKLLFFVLYTSFSAGFSFISLYYTSAGLTVSQLGLMKGIASGFSLVAQPVWGAIVDSTTKHRNLLFISLGIGSTLLEFGKPWLIMLISDTKTVVKCFQNATSTFSIIPSTVNSMNYLSNNFPVFVNRLNKTNCTTSVELMNPDIVFLGATINTILSTIAMSGLMTYVEGVILRTVFTGRKKEHSYGRQKVLGPIGLALGSFGAGVAVDHYHPKRPLSPYLAAFYIYLPLSLLMIPLIYILTKQINWDDQKKKEKRNNSELVGNLKTAFRNTETIMFLASCFIYGLTSSVLMDYLFLFMNDVMHPSKTVMSLTTVVAAISEVFVYPFTSQLIKLFGGHIKSIITAMLMYSVRLAGVSFCTNAWYILPLQILNGFTSALAWTAMIEHTWKTFPKEIINMAIGIFYTFNMTAPGIISNIAGGVLYRRFGGARVFQGMAIINTAWCVVMLFYFVIRKRPMKVSKKVMTVQSGYSRQIDVE